MFIENNELIKGKVQSFKIYNVEGENGAVKNQFIIYINTDECIYSLYQSYSSIIAMKMWYKGYLQIYLDIDKWDYSNTTGKYRNMFLGEKKAETQRKINNGEYIIDQLNK